jgi:hypothetical protein
MYTASPSVKARTKALVKALATQSGVKPAGDKASREGRFGWIIGLGPCGERFPNDTSEIHVTAKASVGVVVGEPNPYTFGLFIVSIDESDRLVAASVGTATVTPGSVRDLGVVVDHRNPGPGKYYVQSWLAVIKGNVEEGIADAGFDKSCTYTVK